MKVTEEMVERASIAFEAGNDMRGSLEAAHAAAPEPKFVDLVFENPPSPEGARFVEAEDERGRSISVGKWLPPKDESDRYWRLRIPLDLTAHRDALNELVEARRNYENVREQSVHAVAHLSAIERWQRAWEVAEKLAGRKG